MQCNGWRTVEWLIFLCLVCVWYILSYSRMLSCHVTSVRTVRCCIVHNMIMKYWSKKSLCLFLSCHVLFLTAGLVSYRIVSSRIISYRLRFVYRHIMHVDHVIRWLISFNHLIPWLTWMDFHISLLNRIVLWIYCIHDDSMYVCIMYVCIYCEQNATLHCILVVMITHRQHIHNTTIMLFANSNDHHIRHKTQIRTCDSNMKSNLQFYFLSSMLMPHATYSICILRDTR